VGFILSCIFLAVSNFSVQNSFKYFLQWWLGGHAFINFVCCARFSFLVQLGKIILMDRLF
jgi:hypothetical protein